MAKNGSIECAKICLKRQKEDDDIEALDTFLHACSAGFLDIVRFFVRSGVEPTNATKKTFQLPMPLECAVNNNHYEVAEELINSGYVKIEINDQ